MKRNVCCKHAVRAVDHIGAVCQKTLRIVVRVCFEIFISASTHFAVYNRKHFPFRKRQKLSYLGW